MWVRFEEGFSERFLGLHFALGQGAGYLGTEGPYSLHLYSPFVVISCSIYLSFTSFWQCYVYDHGVKITFCTLNIFYMKEAITVILFALIYRLEGLSESTFTS